MAIFCAALLAGVLIGTAFASSAFAQADYGSERDVRDRELGTAAGKDFKLTLTMPLLFTTSVLAANSDGTTIDKSDWHFYPDIQLKWAHQYDRVKLTAYGAVSADRYFEVGEADVNVLESGIIAEFTDGKSDRFVPYFSYIVRSYFDREFNSLDDTRHDLALGIFSGVGWRGGTPIRYMDAVHAGEQSFGIDTQVGRREANEKDHEHTFASVALDYTYNFRNDFWVVLGPKIRVRWYENYFDDFRRDIRFSMLAKAVWQPDWLTAMLPHGQLVLSVEYFKNWSTSDINEYSLWELGPTLKVSTRF